MWTKLLLTISIVLLWSVTGSQADTPANCTYEDIRGLWVFQESERVGTRTEQCNDVPSSANKVYLQLDFPNSASDKFGNVGHWTIIYNQGFEVIINYRRYFAFSLYKQQGAKVINHCDRTFPGWSHDVRGNNWACFQGRKVNSWDEVEYEALENNANVKVHNAKPLLFETINVQSYLSQSYVDRINAKQQLWTAKQYPHMLESSTEELIRMAGGRASQVAGRPKPAHVTAETRKLARELPQSFDWRNVGGVNYVSPVRNQAKCGSCYVFASTGLLESRIQIATNNTEKPVFSTQQIVDCSEYSQGCDGGFPYLIAGKFGQDFGVIADECYPYKGKTQKCSPLNSTSNQCQQRTYVFDYHYVGGYYGACNEELMRLELVRNGPIVVGFMVYPDFVSYSKGIYTHNQKDNVWSSDDQGFNPFELTNHAVLVVGYGEDSKTGEKYWIVKNSWGTKWGLDGYFWIKRGNDECGIESLAVAATPIP